MPAKYKTLSGELWEFIVMKVESWDDLGRPRALTAVYDEESVRIQGGEHFLIVLAKSEAVKPKLKGKA